VSAVAAKQLLVFFDLSVLRLYLGRDPSVQHLVEAEESGQIRIATDGTILFYLTLGGLEDSPELQRFMDVMCVLEPSVEATDALDEDWWKTKPLLHTSKLLVLTSAAQCDYLLTEDAHFAEFASAHGVRAVSPAEFLVHLRAA